MDKHFEEIIKKIFEEVGMYQGFNHPDVKRVLRKALKLEAKYQTELRIKDLEEVIRDLKTQRENLEELRKYIAKVDEDGESSLWKSFEEVWYFNVNQTEELTKKINELKEDLG